MAMRRIKLIFYAITILFHTAIHAVPAYPGFIRYRCADGSFVNLQLKGDEFCKWAVTEDGYTLLRDSLGAWTYAEIAPDGNPVPSRWKLSAVRSRELLAFLQQTPKQLQIPSSPALRSAAHTYRSLPAYAPVVGEQRTLVILMQYQDRPFVKSKAEFEALFNQPNYQADGAQGSVKDYFRENSYGQLDLTCDILGPFTASRERQYYGGNNREGQDSNPSALFMEALDYAASLIDLAAYDTDQDGVLNNIHILFAGHGEEAGAPADAIWSHEARFSEPVRMENLQITGYSCAPELRGNSGEDISRIGVHCHEICHSFGAPDFYDTDYQAGGEYSGTGQWDLMGSGNWNDDGISPAHLNPYLKLAFGWSVCEELDREGDILLPPSVEENRIYRLNTETEGDYFLLENRQQIGFDAALPGYGLLVYHILPAIGQRTETNTINAAYPQTCYPVCAVSGYAVPEQLPDSYGNVNTPQCPFSDRHSADEFTVWSIPAARAADGAPSRFGITGIRQEEDGSCAFQVVEEKPLEEQTVIFSAGFEPDEPEWELIQSAGNMPWEKGQASLFKPALPVAFEGQHYLLLNMDKRLIPPTTSIAVSPMIAAASPAGEKVLTFRYVNREAFDAHGTIRVLYRPADAADWQCLATLSEVQIDWALEQLKLPDGSARFQMAFEGAMVNGLAAIDDVNVYSDTPSITALEPIAGTPLLCRGGNGQVEVTSAMPGNLRIYSLSGKWVRTVTLKQGRQTIPLSAGLYIGVFGTQTIKFSVH